MKSLNPSPENSRRSGVIGLGLIPGHGPSVISLKVSHGHNHYEVSVPSNSNFGYLKSVISQSLGLKPETCKLLFGGIEKQDEETLQLAGLKDNSEVLLVESVCEQVPEEVQETPVASKGEEAVAEARKDIDKLEQQVSALQAVIDSGKKVDEKEIMYLTEMLMRQLLNLDGIEAEGEGRLKRKTEVRRVQNIVETLDALKSRNSNSSNHSQRSLSASSEWRAFDDSPSSAPPPAPTASASPAPPPPAPTASPSPAPPPPAPTASPSPAPPPPAPTASLSLAPPVVQSPFPSPMLSHPTYTVPYPTPSNIPPPNYPSVPNFSPPSNFPVTHYPVHTPYQYYTPSTPQPFQYYDPTQYYDPSLYYNPSQMAYPAYPSVPSPAPAPAPHHVPSSNPFSMPSSTKVTENWEHFG